jgi:hypothetical protein
MSQISIYPSLFSSRGYYNTDINSLLETIKHPNTLVEDIRSTSDKEEKQELKKQLPCILFAGTFQKRNKDSLVDSSGYMILDFDKVENLEAKKHEIFNHHFVKAVFVSPSGTGLKALIKIRKVKNNDEFVIEFKRALEYFPEIDPSGKDICRVCFMSYDPDIFIKNDEEVEELYLDDFVVDSEYLDVKKEISDQNLIERLLKWWRPTYYEGNRNNACHALACKLLEVGIDDLSLLIDECKDLDKNEVISCYKSSKNTIPSVKFGFKRSEFEPSYSSNNNYYQPSFQASNSFFEEFPELNNKPTKTLTPEMILWLLKELDFVFKKNERTGKLTCNDKLLTDGLISIINNKIRTYLYNNKIYTKDVKTNVIFDVINEELENNTFDPLKNTLKALKWDGVSRLNHAFLSKYIKDNNNIFAEYLNCFLYGVVKKIHYNNHFNPVLVIGGMSGIGKSSFARWLCSPFGNSYFSDSPLNLQDKDIYFEAGFQIIHELPEGKSVSRHDRDALKSFLTRTDATVRRPYGRMTEEVKMISNFIATFNFNEDIFDDASGTRRFMTVDVTNGSTFFKLMNEVEPTQLLAEAYETFLVTPDFKATDLIDSTKQSQINDTFSVHDPLDEVLDEVLDDCEGFIPNLKIRSKIRMYLSDNCLSYSNIPINDRQLDYKIRQYFLKKYNQKPLSKNNQRGFLLSN